MPKMRAKVINIFGGPGIGKSTTAAGIFYFLKLNSISTELVREYAKEITWEEIQVKLEDQFAVTAEQNRRMWCLRKKVDWIITDSPILLGIHYKQPDYFPNYYDKMLWEIWHCYDNLNFFLERTKEYQPEGRNQTKEEAIEIDRSIKTLLDDHDIPYEIIAGDKNAAPVIADKIKERI